MKKLSVVFAVVAVSGTAFANVAEDKARKQAETQLNADAQKVKASCGNAELTVQVDWAGYDGMTVPSPKNHRTKEDLLSKAYDSGGIGLRALLDLCKDADYKKAISKFTKFVVHPSGQPYEVTFKLNGSTIDEVFSPDVYDGDMPKARESLKKQL
jgi:hypothetical protein